MWLPDVVSRTYVTESFSATRSEPLLAKSSRCTGRVPNLEPADKFSISKMPKFDVGLAVTPSGCDELVIERDCDCANDALARIKGSNNHPLRNIPDDNPAKIFARDKEFRISTERNHIDCRWRAHPC